VDATFESILESSESTSSGKHLSLDDHVLERTAGWKKRAGGG